MMVDIHSSFVLNNIPFSTFSFYIKIYFRISSYLKHYATNKTHNYLARKENLNLSIKNTYFETKLQSLA